jgi:hypothetical protein
MSRKFGISKQGLVFLAAGCGAVIAAHASGAVITAVDTGGTLTEATAYTSPVDSSTSSWVTKEFTSSGTSTAGVTPSYNSGNTYATNFFTVTGLDTTYTQNGTLTFSIPTAGFSQRITRTNDTGAFANLYNTEEILVGGTQYPFVISGLLPNTQYGITIQSMDTADDNSSGPRPGTFTPVTVGVTNPAAKTSQGFDVANVNQETPNDPLTSVSFNGSSALESDSNGNIVLDAFAGNSPRINGVEIYTPTATPEPAALGLLTVGTLSLLARRRREMV